MSFLLPEGLRSQDETPSVIELIWVGYRLDLRVQREWPMESGGRCFTVSAPGWEPAPPPHIADWYRRAVV